MEAIFDRYKGWVPRPSAKDDSGPGGGKNEDNTSHLIDTATGFKESLQEIIKDQEELNRKIDYIIENWSMAMAK